MKSIIVLCSILLLLVPFTVIAQEIDYCEGNFDYDKDVDGTDAFVFKSDFGRSSLINSCPPDGPAPVPKTGQTTSYYDGDDGHLQKGVAWPNPRFTDNGDGTVTDNLTGLIWLKNANCFGQRTWNDALSDCNGLENGECGLTDGSGSGDWRLPNLRELQSLIDYSQFALALPSPLPFVNVQAGVHWSSTHYAEQSYDQAWGVLMVNGVLQVSTTSMSLYVLPVRGGH